jgi:hypothetical protein
MEISCEYTELAVVDSRNIMAFLLRLGEGIGIFPCINDEQVTK